MKSCSRLWSLLPILLLPAVVQAHPGAGLGNDLKGRIFFTDTGAGVWVVEKGGELKRVSDSAVHWMAVFAEGGKLDFGPKFEVFQPPVSGTTLILASDQPCAADSDGRLIFAGVGEGLSVHRRDKSAKESIVCDDARLKKVFPGATVVTGIAAAKDGSVYVLAADDASGAHAVVAIGSGSEVSLLAANFLGHVPAETKRDGQPGNPCRGIACDNRGGVAVAGTAHRCVVRIDRDGKARVVLRSSSPWSPTAVAFQGDDLLVLEYTDMPPGADQSDRSLWVPRVRRLAATGEVSLVAEVKRP